MNFRRANQSDSADLLRWRNDPETRRASFSEAEISPAEHEKWFAAALENPLKVILICEEGNQPIGTVRFEKRENESWEMSWTVAPEARGKGFGKTIVREGAREFLSGRLGDYSGELFARVKDGNPASAKIAEQAGFVASEDGVWRYR